MLRPVARTKPAAPWLGGKTKLVETIAPMIESIDHDTYVEPFVGMGGMFFGRCRAPSCEVINDRNSELYNFFRQLQSHYQQLMDELKWRVTSREQFDILKSQDPATLTELQRAARFIYLQVTAFGGKTSGQSFGISAGRSGRFDFNSLAPRLQDIYNRLSGVVLENLDWLEIINRYDTRQTLFYLDPPYWNCENDYGKGLFTKDDFKKMADRLSKIEGSFILSLNDVEEVRSIFKSFNVRAVETTYTIATKASKKVGEVVISNRDMIVAQGVFAV
jgi:DNA adenine methylase